LKLSYLNTWTNFQSILQIGNHHFQRLPGIWVLPNTATHFHIGFDDGQFGWNIDLPAMGDLQSHNFDIQVYAKDKNCKGDGCTAIAEFNFDGVNYKTSEMGARLNDNEEDAFIHITEPYQYEPYPGALIGNIIYKPYGMTPLAPNQAYCPHLSSTCNQAIPTYREYHLKFDLRLSYLNRWTNYQSIIQIGDTNAERLPGVWVLPNTATTFHIMFSNSNGGAQDGWTVDIPEFADLKTHTIDIKVHAKDQRCRGASCAAVAEFALDGVRHDIRDISTRLNDAEEDTFMYITNPFGLHPRYPGAFIGEIVYESYSP